MRSCSRFRESTSATSCPRQPWPCLRWPSARGPRPASPPACRRSHPAPTCWCLERTDGAFSNSFHLTIGAVGPQPGPPRRRPGALRRGAGRRPGPSRRPTRTRPRQLSRRSLRRGVARLPLAPPAQGVAPAPRHGSRLAGRGSRRTVDPALRRAGAGRRHPVRALRAAGGAARRAGVPLLSAAAGLPPAAAARRGRGDAEQPSRSPDGLDLPAPRRTRRARNRPRLDSGGVPGVDHPAPRQPCGVVIRVESRLAAPEPPASLGQPSLACTCVSGLPDACGPKRARDHGCPAVLGVVGIRELVEDHGELLVLAEYRGILPQGGFAQPPPVSAAVELADHRVDAGVGRSVFRYGVLSSGPLP